MQEWLAQTFEVSKQFWPCCTAELNDMQRQRLKCQCGRVMGRRGMSESISCQESKLARLSTLSDLVCKCSIDGLVVIDTPPTFAPLLFLTAAFAMDPACKQTEFTLFFMHSRHLFPRKLLASNCAYIKHQCTQTAFFLQQVCPYIKSIERDVTAISLANTGIDRHSWQEWLSSNLSLKPLATPSTVAMQLLLVNQADLIHENACAQASDKKVLMHQQTSCWAVFKGCQRD